MAQRRIAMRLALVVAAAALASGCGNGDGNDNGQTGTATATRTRTATSGNVTATRTPTIGATITVTPQATATTGSTSEVNGLLVLNRAVNASAGDALGLPPAEALPAADGASFTRALSHADWSVVGSQEVRGVTAADGRFRISGLGAGRYTLLVDKTLDGNLVSVGVPFGVGDDGTAEVLAEVSWGQVRSTSSYTYGGASIREIHGPNGTWLVTRDGGLIEIADSTQVLVDPDGDGHFIPQQCVEQLWRCDAPGQVGGVCGEDRFCSCTASCPSCEDCGPGVCVPVGPLPPYVCNDAGICKLPPYRCDDDGTCAQPGDRCACVSSCPDCDDCVLEVCVPSCDPVDVVSLTITFGPSQLVLGQQGSMIAVAQLSDGTSVDVTHLVEWQSSNPTIATVDTWGTVSALTIGSTTLTATIGDLSSAPWPLEVVERPTLRRIYVQNVSCFFPLGRPGFEDGAPPIGAPPAQDSPLPFPACHQVVQIGGTIQFQAVGEFDNGYYDDITDEVAWSVTPSEIGDVAQGLFTARQEGTGQLTAALEGVASDPTEIRVVTEPTIVSISIYADNGGFPVLLGRPIDASAPDFCLDCGYTLTVLRGDQLRFHATAQYDTGAWQDVTDQVTWRSSNLAVATIDATGLMVGVEGGDAQIDATLGDVVSNAVDVRVVNEATLQSISVYTEVGDRVLAKGEQLFFHATGFYDVGFSRDATTEATWRSSDEAVGGFDTPGVFTGRGAGTVQVWADLAGVQSERYSLEVFEASELDYCDPDHVNRGVWSDDFNRVVLESDCADYTQPDVVALRYTVTETRPHGGIFDPCLDLYVYRGNQRIRTLREEGCGDPFLAAAAPGRDEETVLKYQLRAFWDLKDESGAPVPSGVYTVFGRFYLYYDPVVSIQVAVVGPDGGVACTQNPCGNGCGYVHACGDGDPPLICPTVCVSLCECPAGWGITPEGDCERCPDECCPPGAVCAPGLPPCTSPIECCPFNESCAPDVPPCSTVCCPPNARCTADILPCQSLPDLVPSDVHLGRCSPDDCVPRQLLDVCVTNQGDAAAGPFRTLLNAQSLDFSGLAPGQSACAEAPYVNRATVAVDINGQVAESREDNNRMSFTVPTPVPTGCDTIPPNCTPSAPQPTPTPIPAPGDFEGLCFRGVRDCTGSSMPASQAKCCEIFRLDASILTISWCSNDQLGECSVCRNPCDGLS